MNKNRPERELVIDLLARSQCKVQVACLIADEHGIISWGWNHSIGIRGVHAEVMALKRANRKRLLGARIVIAGRWKESGNWAPAIPCEDCLPLLKKWGVEKIEHTTKSGGWDTWDISLIELSPHRRKSTRSPKT